MSKKIYRLANFPWDEKLATYLLGMSKEPQNEELRFHDHEGALDQLVDHIQYLMRKNNNNGDI